MNKLEMLSEHINAIRERLTELETWRTETQKKPAVLRVAETRMNTRPETPQIQQCYHEYEADGGPCIHCGKTVGELLEESLPPEPAQELKPGCPFCDGEEIDRYPLQMSGRALFECADCGAEITLADKADWNKRPIEDELRAEIDKLKAENERLKATLDGDPN